MKSHYQERHNIAVSSFFFCWLCSFFSQARDDLWKHLGEKHKSAKEDLTRDKLQRGLYRPKRKETEEEPAEDPNPTKKSRAAPYSNELGPEPEYSV